jgi:hypothetical protein
MRQRHIQITAVVRRAIERSISGELKSEIRKNTTMEEEGSSEETQNLRPDMAFERQEGSRRVIEVIEFSCPYGDVMREGDTLKHVFEQKRRKYAQLMPDLSEVTQSEFG